MQDRIVRRFSATRQLPTLSLVLMTMAMLRSAVVQAHFIFAEVVDGDGDGQKHARVYFSEPVAIGGDGIEFLGGRVTQLGMLGPRNNVHNDEVEANHPMIDLVDIKGNGYLSGTLPPPDAMENTPYFISGFLDYGDFGEGTDGTKRDLQYTFSAQLSSTNPSDDFTQFLHPVLGTNANSSLLNHPTELDPFTIALKNYGPPYRVVVRGVSKTTPISVCLYEGFDGTNRKVGCAEGSHGGAHHLTLESFAATEVLRPCRTYFALANATVADEVSGREKSLWSSTSVTWNGPCDNRDGFRRTPVPTWYVKAPFGRPRAKDTGCIVAAEASFAATEAAASAPLSSPGLLVALALVFVGGLLVGAFVFPLMKKAAGIGDRGSSEHSKIDSGNEDTVGFSDDATLVEGVREAELL